MTSYDEEYATAKRLFRGGWKVDVQPGEIYTRDADSQTVSIFVWALLRAMNHGAVCALQ